MDKFPLSPVPILGPMQDSADFCRPLAAISGVEIKLEIVDQCREAILQSNALRLQQVLINLCSNAIKYTCSGTTILVSSKLSSRQDVETMINNSLACGPIEDSPAITTENSVDQVVVFSVRDEGAGISPGQEKKMFWKISQLDSDLKNKLGDEIAGQPTGTGLGLNLCLKFVQLLGGNIWVTNNTGDVDASSRNGGSTFSFYIPLDSFGNSNNKKVGATLDVPYKGGGDDLSFPLDIEFQSEKEAAAKSSKFEVLLVDDTLINRKVFERMLKRVDWVKTIVTADSAKTALELLEQNTFNIVSSFWQRI